MKTFAGPVLFLDRSDINTDEIIPANYLAELPKQELTSHLFENLKIEGFNPKSDIAGTKVIITKENFGCGAESEKAPWALEVNGINEVHVFSSIIISRNSLLNLYPVLLKNILAL